MTTLEFTIWVDQRSQVEWGLNLQQAHLFGFFHIARGWATEIEDGYRYLAKNKILESIPGVVTKIDTLYRLQKQLAEKDLISIRRIKGKQCFRILPKGESWNRYQVGKKSDPDDSESEKNPITDAKLPANRKKIRPESEKNPNRTGKKSDVSNIHISNNQISDKPKGNLQSPLPEFIPVDLWNGYYDSRKSMGNHPMAESALRLTIKAITNCVDSGIPVEEVMTLMIENGWRTVKPEWVHNAKNGSSGKSAQKGSRDTFTADEILGLTRAKNTPLGIFAHTKIGNDLGRVHPSSHRQYAQQVIALLPNFIARASQGKYTPDELALMDRYGVDPNSALAPGIEPPSVRVDRSSAKTSGGVEKFSTQQREANKAHVAELMKQVSGSA